jgi:NIMA (never in mitosis gene a)-related kinase
LKRVDLSKLGDKELENSINEVRLLASIKNPNVVTYKDAFIDEPS